MPTFSADQIVGKTLTARRTLVAFDLPIYEQGFKKIGEIKPGQSAGVVFSYVGGRPGEPLHWQFKGNNGKMYYIPHLEGNFLISSLRDQGALTTQEIKEKDESANMSTGEQLTAWVKKSGNLIIYAGLGLLALNVILKNRK